MEVKLVKYIILVMFNIELTMTKPDKTKLKEDASHWERMGKADLKNMLNIERNEGTARNIIFFVGDGMGVQTHTMARIYKGQLKGDHGEEAILAWERFPSTGIIKTYNTDYQVPDSAGTATAMFSGVKTGLGMLGLDNRATYNICDSSAIERATIESLADWGVASGKEVGVVSTARITHATPAAMYSHCPMRDWESDSDLPKGSTGCQDIASQLVDSVESGKLKVALGGGRRGFLKKENGGKRNGVDLVERFREMEGVDYLETSGDLQKRDADNDKTVVGLFSMSHMDYELDRNNEDDGQPNLADMTRVAINRLKRQDTDGFVLMVEGGRIDHAHHANRAKMALEETLQLELAVETALELTSRTDTLIVVTADHSHAVTMSGYPQRGNPILGVVHDPSQNLVVVNPVNGLSQPYTTIGYANGPGFNYHWDNKTNFWKNLTNIDTSDNSFEQMATFHLNSETHGGEDVTAYAIGPQAHLVSGVHEQSYLAHMVAYAGCLRRDQLGCPEGERNSGDKMNSTFSLTVFVVFIIAVLTPFSYGL